MKAKVFTEKQIERLPEEGYWLQFSSGSSRPTAICNMNGRIKYIHSLWGEEWCTLLWSCCFTKKQIERKEWGETYEHFKTHADLVKAHPELDSYFHVKAPNDTSEQETYIQQALSNHPKQTIT